MNREEFIEALKIVVASSISSEEESLIDPPGRRPKPEDIAISDWYKSLSTENKEHLRYIMYETANTMSLAWLRILDGLESIEKENNGLFRLYFTKYGKTILINDPTKENLSLLYMNS